MNLTFTCPQCESGNRVELDAQSTGYACSQCGQSYHVPEGAVVGNRVIRCLVCPSTDLFVRKDFPQRLGVTIVVAGILASTVAWAYSRPILTYAILFGTALLDLVLYLIMPDALMCYRCAATYRGTDLTEHESFQLETHERYRQQEARRAQTLGHAPMTKQE